MGIESVERRGAGARLGALLPTLLVAGFVLVALAAGEPALASDAGMPWESALTKVRNSLTGPVALVIAILGIVVCGAMLVFGGDLQEFTRRMIYLVLAVSILVSASSLVTLLFGFTAAVV